MGCAWIHYPKAMHWQDQCRVGSVGRISCSPSKRVNVSHFCETPQDLFKDRCVVLVGSQGVEMLWTESIPVQTHSQLDAWQLRHGDGTCPLGVEMPPSKAAQVFPLLHQIPTSGSRWSRLWGYISQKFLPDLEIFRGLESFPIPTDQFQHHKAFADESQQQVQNEENPNPEADIPCCSLGD